jgi:hypothetical protein
MSKGGGILSSGLSSVKTEMMSFTLSMLRILNLMSAMFGFRASRESCPAKLLIDDRRALPKNEELSDITDDRLTTRHCEGKS